MLAWRGCSDGKSESLGLAEDEEPGHGAMVVCEQRSSFPLSTLPPPVLALVLYWLPLHKAAQAASVCKSFQRAFGDAVSWKRRALRDIRDLDVEKTFSAENHDSWQRFYQRHADFRVRIVTVFHSQYGQSLTGEFSMSVCPRLTVADFVTLVGKHPLNRQHDRPRLMPHDPAALELYDFSLRRPVRTHPDGKPNCSFWADEGAISIVDAGLCPGAVLAQPESNMLD